MRLISTPQKQQKRTSYFQEEIGLDEVLFSKKNYWIYLQNNFNIF